MGKIVELQTGKNAVLIESSDVDHEGGVVQATGLNLQKNLDQMLERLQPFCESIIKNFEALSLWLQERLLFRLHSTGVSIIDDTKRQ